MVILILLVEYKYFLNGGPHRPGDVHRQLQGGVVLSLLQPHDSLPPHPYQLRQAFSSAFAAFSLNRSSLRVLDIFPSRNIRGPEGIRIHRVDKPAAVVRQIIPHRRALLPVSTAFDTEIRRRCQIPPEFVENRRFRP